MSDAEEAAELYGLKVWKDHLCVKHQDAAEKSFLAGVTWARENPGWVSVEDRLPPPDLDVIGWNADGHPSFELCFYDGSDWAVHHYGGIPLIRHWAPLPKSPNQEEE